MNGKDYILSGIIEQYVLGLCTPLEKAEVELLRKTDTELNDAIINFEIQFENEMMNSNSLPDEVTDTNIIEKIDSLTTTPLIPFNSVKESENNYKWLKTLAAASVILLVTSVSFNYILYSNNKKQQLELAARIKNLSITLPINDYNVLKDPTITPIAMYGVGYHSICRCTMFWDKKTGKVYIMIHHLPKSSSKEDYQLWANVDGKTISVGIIDDTIRDRFIEMTNMPEGAISFIVTLEKANGADQPTKEEIYLKGSI
jgi:anti-sigma-K factor RskA